MDDFEFVENGKCGFDQDIDSSDNAALHDEYDIKKEIRQVTDLKKHLKEQTVECSILIQTLKEERDEYKKLKNNLQCDLAQISQLKESLQNDHDKFNKMLLSFNSITKNKLTNEVPVEKKENNFDWDQLNDEMLLQDFKKMLNTATIVQNNQHSGEILPNELPQWVQGCFQNDALVQYESCTNIRKILSIAGNPPIQQVINSGVVPRLIQFLRMQRADSLQFEAAWALTNITSGTAEQTATVIRAGAVTTFIELISSNKISVEVQEQLIWALGNIAGDSAEARDLVTSHNVLSELKSICMNHATYGNYTISFIRNLSWVLVNFCRPKPTPKWQFITQIIECYNNLIANINDDEVFSNYLWAFYYLTRYTDDSNNLLISSMVNSGVVQKSVDLLGHSAKTVSLVALRVLGNIVAGQNDNNTWTVLRYNVLSKLHDYLLSNVTDAEKEDILWTLSNITAGTNEQLQYVIQSNILPTVVNILNECNKYNIAKEALWTIANTINTIAKSQSQSQNKHCDNETQMKYLININSISAIFSFLKRFNHLNESKQNNKYNKLILIALESIKNILSIDTNNMNYIEKCDGLNVLKLIQSSNVTDNISNEIRSILLCENKQIAIASDIVLDKEITGDDMVLQSSKVHAWRYDNEQKKWRRRGKGWLMLYRNETYKYIKIVFKDANYNNKIRLLQQINISVTNKNKCAINDEMEIEWNGNDYSMDINKPMNSVWKVKFIDEPQKTQTFVDVFNNAVRGINQ